MAQSGKAVVSRPAKGRVTCPVRPAHIVAFEWIKTNYEVTEDDDTTANIPKSTVFEQYSKYCQEHREHALVTADFGRILRSVFPKARDRRLGSRGNSHYYYTGIKAKAMGNGTISSTAISEEDMRLAHETVICEWASTVLSRTLSSTPQLARYLVLNRFVQTRSASALTIAAKNRDCGSETLVDDSEPEVVNPHRETQLKLQEKLRERLNKKASTSGDTTAGGVRAHPRPPSDQSQCSQSQSVSPADQTHMHPDSAFSSACTSPGAAGLCDSLVSAASRHRSQRPRSDSAAPPPSATTTSVAAPRSAHPGNQSALLPACVNGAEATSSTRVEETACSLGATLGSGQVATGNQPHATHGPATGVTNWSSVLGDHQSQSSHRAPLESGALPTTMHLAGMDRGLGMSQQHVQSRLIQSAPATPVFRANHPFGQAFSALTNAAVTVQQQQQEYSHPNTASARGSCCTTPYGGESVLSAHGSARSTPVVAHALDPHVLRDSLAPYAHQPTAASDPCQDVTQQDMASRHSLPCNSQCNTSARNTPTVGHGHGSSMQPPSRSSSTYSRPPTANRSYPPSARPSPANVTSGDPALMSGVPTDQYGAPAIGRHVDSSSIPLSNGGTDPCYPALNPGGTSGPGLVPQHVPQNQPAVGNNHCVMSNGLTDGMNYCQPLPTNTSNVSMSYNAIPSQQLSADMSSSSFAGNLNVQCQNTQSSFCAQDGLVAAPTMCGELDQQASLNYGSSVPSTPVVGHSVNMFSQDSTGHLSAQPTPILSESELLSTLTESAGVAMAPEGSADAVVSNMNPRSADPYSDLSTQSTPLNGEFYRASPARVNTNAAPGALPDPTYQGCSAHSTPRQTPVPFGCAGVVPQGVMVAPTAHQPCAVALPHHASHPSTPTDFQPCGPQQPGYQQALGRQSFNTLSNVQMSFTSQQSVPAANHGVPNSMAPPNAPSFGPHVGSTGAIAGETVGNGHLESVVPPVPSSNQWSAFMRVGAQPGEPPSASVAAPQPSACVLPSSNTGVMQGTNEQTSGETGANNAGMSNDSSNLPADDIIQSYFTSNANELWPFLDQASEHALPVKDTHRQQHQAALAELAKVQDELKQVEAQLENGRLSYADQQQNLPLHARGQDESLTNKLLHLRQQMADLKKCVKEKEMKLNGQQMGSQEGKTQVACNRTYQPQLKALLSGKPVGQQPEACLRNSHGPPVGTTTMPTAGQGMGAGGQLSMNLQRKSLTSDVPIRVPIPRVMVATCSGAGPQHIAMVRSGVGAPRQPNNGSFHAASTDAFSNQGTCTRPANGEDTSVGLSRQTSVQAAASCNTPPSTPTGKFRPVAMPVSSTDSYLPGPWSPDSSTIRTSVPVRPRGPIRWPSPAMLASANSRRRHCSSPARGLSGAAGPRRFGTSNACAPSLSQPPSAPGSERSTPVSQHLSLSSVHSSTGTGVMSPPLPPPSHPPKRRRQFSGEGVQAQAPAAAPSSNGARGASLTHAATSDQELVSRALVHPSQAVKLLEIISKKPLESAGQPGGPGDYAARRNLASALQPSLFNKPTSSPDSPADTS